VALPEDDPVLRHARREAWWIGGAWLTVTATVCATCYSLGYARAGWTPGVGDLRPILGIPRWFALGVVVPWVVSGLFIAWFAGSFMTDDDLGADHAAELEADIREEGAGHA
jgi:hypothetical protein